MRDSLDTVEDATAPANRTNAAGRLLAVLDAFGQQQRRCPTDAAGTTCHQRHLVAPRHNVHNIMYIMSVPRPLAVVSAVL